MSLRPKLVPIVFVFLALLAAADDKALQDQLTKADQLYRAGQYEDATREYVKAVKLSGEKSQVALLSLAKGYRAVGARELCVEKALKSAEVATSNMQRADGHWLAGLCHTEQKDQDSYSDAEAEFKTALQLAPENYEILVSLGSLYIKQHRDAEGVAEIKKYLEKRPNGPLAVTAKTLIALPGIARLDFTPEFTIKTFDDRTITTKDLAGKIVVIDFWAPWCVPCRAALPHLRAMLKQYSGKQLQVISVCTDEKEDVWRKFIQENAMDWPQYYDRNATMKRLFYVTNYPTYVIIDTNGIIRTKVIGVDEQRITIVENELKKVMENPAPVQQQTNVPAIPGTVQH